MNRNYIFTLTKLLILTLLYGCSSTPSNDRQSSLCLDKKSNQASLCPDSNQAHRNRNDDIIIMDGFSEVQTKSNPELESIGIYEYAKTPSKMTFEELSQCVPKKISIVHQLLEFEKETKENYKNIIQRKQKLQQEIQAIELNRMSVDVNNSKQVQDFNKRAEQSRLDASQINTDGEIINSKVSNFKKQRADFDAVCANRFYTYLDFSNLPLSIRNSFNELQGIRTDIINIEQINELKEKLHFSTH